MASSEKHIGGFRAFGLGVRALRRNGPLWFFAVTSEALLAACRQALLVAGALALVAAFIRALGDGPHASPMRVAIPVAGSWLVLAAITGVVRLVYLGAAVVDASEALQTPDRTPEPVTTAAARVFPRAVAASIWLWVIEVVADLCRGIFIVSALLIAFAHGAQRSAAWAAPIALAITLSFLVAFGFELFGRVYLVKAIRHLDVGALAAAWEAGRSLLARLGAFVLITIIAFVLEAAGGMVTGGVDALPSGSHRWLGRLFVLVAAAIAAGWQGAVEIATIGAICAVDLDARGELPRPPSHEPVYEARPVERAEEVHIAQVVEPKPSS